MPDILVTGGTGFIGSNLVRGLVARGRSVRVFDNDFRGRQDNLADIADHLDGAQGDIRDPEAVRAAMEGIETVYHLAYVNGTEFFYSKPELVLDVALRGQLNCLDAARDAGVKTFVYASSSEVYQTPSVVPTPEDVPGVVPDVHNPRYSYGGGKLISELLLFHYARESAFKKVVFRPHNIYGPAMGFEHVVPQIVRKISDATAHFTQEQATIEIQGEGSETRAFCYVDDAVDGIILAAEKGDDDAVYHVGKPDEVSIRHLIELIGQHCCIDLTIEPGPLQPGGTPRRCPDISKLAALGYAPKVGLDEGLARTVSWYVDYYKEGA